MLDEEKTIEAEAGCDLRTAPVIYLLPANRRGDLVMDQITGSLADLEKKLSSHLQDLTEQKGDIELQKRTLEDIDKELDKRIQATQQMLASASKMKKESVLAVEPLKVADPETIRQHMAKSSRGISQTVLPLARG